MSWTLTTSGVAILKAGSNANSTITASGSALASFSDLVEGRIVTETKRDWVSNYSSLTTAETRILSDLASDMIAFEIIGYDLETEASRSIETKLDVLSNKIGANLKILKEGDVRGLIDF